MTYEELKQMLKENGSKICEITFSEDFKATMGFKKVKWLLEYNAMFDQVLYSDKPKKYAATIPFIFKFEDVRIV